MTYKIPTAKQIRMINNLEYWYFKECKTIKWIAENSGFSKSVVWKRLEELREKLGITNTQPCIKAKK